MKYEGKLKHILPALIEMDEDLIIEITEKEEKDIYKLQKRNKQSSREAIRITTKGKAATVKGFGEKYAIVWEETKRILMAVPKDQYMPRALVVAMVAEKLKIEDANNLSGHFSNFKKREHWISAVSVSKAREQDALYGEVK